MNECTFQENAWVAALETILPDLAYECSVLGPLPCNAKDSLAQDLFLKRAARVLWEASTHNTHDKGVQRSSASSAEPHQMQGACGGDSLSPSSSAVRAGSSNDKYEGTDLVDREPSLKSSHTQQLLVRPKIKYCMLRPMSRFRLVWDLVVFVLIFIEAFLIPVEIGFNVDFGMGWLVFTTLFFSVDIVLNCITSYLDENGEVVTDRILVMRQYVWSRWFPIDLASTIPWTALLEDSRGGMVKRARSMKMTKMVKMFRFLRIMRAFKLAKAMLQYQAFMTQPHKKVAAQCLLLGLLFVYVLHASACVWRGIGGEMEDIEWYEENHEWLDCLPGGPCEPGLDGSPWMFRYKQHLKSVGRLYVMAIYHSAAQMVLSSDSLTPGTDAERLHVVSSQVINFFITSFILAVIMQMTLAYDPWSEQRKRNLNYMRALMVTRLVPVGLRMRIERQLEWQLERARYSLCNYEKIMEEMSPTLRAELKLHFFGPALNAHSFFSKLAVSAVMDVASRAYTLDLMADDIVCMEGETSSAMFIIMSGSVQVCTSSQAKQSGNLADFRNQISDATGFQSGDALLKPLETHDQIAEECVFLNKPVNYSSVVIQAVELLCITAELIQTAMVKSPSSRVVFQQYTHELALRYGAHGTLLCIANEEPEPQQSSSMASTGSIGRVKMKAAAAKVRMIGKLNDMRSNPASHSHPAISPTARKSFTLAAEQRASVRVTQIETSRKSMMLDHTIGGAYVPEHVPHHASNLSPSTGTRSSPHLGSHVDYRQSAADDGRSQRMNQSPTLLQEASHASPRTSPAADITEDSGKGVFPEKAAISAALPQRHTSIGDPSGQMEFKIHTPRDETDTRRNPDRSSSHPDPLQEPQVLTPEPKSQDSLDEAESKHMKRGLTRQVTKQVRRPTTTDLFKTSAALRRKNFEMSPGKRA